MEEITYYFECLYASETFPRPSLEEISFPSIFDSLGAWMERDFEDDEISLALSKCGGHKTSSSDGFNFSLIKAAWDVLKAYFCKMLLEFNCRVDLARRLM